MAKKRLTIAQEYKQELRRFKRAHKRALKRGYFEEKSPKILEMPKRPTRKALERLRQTPTSAIYEEMRLTVLRTGEILSGQAARRYERSQAAKIGRDPYKRVYDVYKRFTVGAPVSAEARDLLDNLALEAGLREGDQKTEKSFAQLVKEYASSPAAGLDFGLVADAISAAEQAAEQRERERKEEKPREPAGVGVGDSGIYDMSIIDALERMASLIPNEVFSRKRGGRRGANMIDTTNRKNLFISALNHKIDEATRGGKAGFTAYLEYLDKNFEKLSECLEIWLVSSDGEEIYFRLGEAIEIVLSRALTIDEGLEISIYADEYF